MSLLEDIAAEAIRLAGAGGLGLATVLALLVVSAVVLVLARKVGGLKLPPYVPEPPPPDAVWGDNVRPNDDFDDRPPG